MSSAFNDLLDDLAAFQRARGSGGSLQKSLSKPSSDLSGFDVQGFRESQRRASANASRSRAELNQAMKSLTTFATTARMETRPAQMTLLKAKFAELDDRFGAAARSGQLSAHEVAKLQIVVNHLGGRLAAIEQAGVA